MSKTRVIIYVERPPRDRYMYSGKRLTVAGSAPPCDNSLGPPQMLLAPLPLSSPASAKNSCDSSLLHKLPPEIRMRIYEYALGGNTIVFKVRNTACRNRQHDRWKSHCKAYRCKAYVGEELSEEREERLGDKSVFYIRPAREAQYRSAGTWEYADSISLELLLVCRQIYNEAVLVPFRANDFGLPDNKIELGLLPRRKSDDRQMVFLLDLIPEQSRAISTLHLRGPSGCRFDQKDLEALSGLKRLKLGFDWNMKKIKEFPDRLLEALEEQFDDSGASRLTTVNFQTVDITVELTVLYHDVGPVVAQRKELLDWVESKRSLLLAGQNPVVPNRRAAI